MTRPVYTPRRLHALVEPRASQIEHLERVAAATGERDGDAVVAAYRPGARGAPTRRVTFYAPCYAERFSPWSPERTGIGGSEEALILAARRVAAAGARVEVYAAVPDLCVDRDVVWRPFEEFDPTASVDVLVSHRTAHLLAHDHLAAREHHVWLHDVPAANFLEPFKHAERAASFLFVSDWQAGEYRRAAGVPVDRCRRCPNVAEPGDRPDGAAPRHPHRAVYASAPYRGLHLLVDLWPRVRERVPDAELHVAYGWQVHDAMAKSYPELARIKARIEARLHDPGISWHGRLPSADLRALLQSANVLAYPCTFAETSCRAAIRALACGCVPVYRPLAALAETIGPHGAAVPADDPEAPEFAERFVEAIVREFERPSDEATRAAAAAEVRARHEAVAYPVWDEIANPARTAR